jgi:menaquinol-cytochrome c reductase iron-sulfur subunit
MSDSEELTRRTFMAKATLTLGGVMGLGLAVPLIGATIPMTGAGSGKWAPLDDAGWKQLQTATDTPVQITFLLSGKDAYLPAQQAPESVWGIKTDLARFERARPDVYANPKGRVPYPAVTMGFALFSPICPHLGCSYRWLDDAKHFWCPCHGSTYSPEGEHLGGPAARGLDPLPLRERNDVAEVTWIRYAPTTPDRILVSYIS